MIGIAKTMYCFVKLPNSVVLDVDVDPKADAQECLHKVLDHLNIIESDYFGLQYTTKDGCPAWLNLRNPIDQQLGMAGPAPYRLSLRVKFYVQPHRILQQSTRHQFYLNVKQDLRDGHLRLVTRDQLAALAAHIAQAEYGDRELDATAHLPLNSPLSGGQYAHLLPGINGTGTGVGGGSPSEGSEEEERGALVRAVAAVHHGLRGMTPEAAQYRALQAAATMHCYGMEFFNVALEQTAVNELYSNRSNKHVKGQSQHIMGVGPTGVYLYNSKLRQKRMFAYPSVHRITSCARHFSLLVFRDSPGGGGGVEAAIDVRAASRAAASALYRCVTEMYCFYLCETVRDNVQTQFSRDLKGHLVSLFNGDSTLGKKYTFDIRRTAKEAYDHYRRELYKAGIPVSGVSGVSGVGGSIAVPGGVQQHSRSPASLTAPSSSNPNQHQNASLNATSSTTTSSSSSAPPCCQALREQVAALQDAVTCVLCVDAPLAVRFAPCSHVLCCAACATRLDTCPVCRTTIADRQPIYMPNLPSNNKAPSTLNAPKMPSGSAPSLPMANSSDDISTQSLLQRSRHSSTHSSTQRSRHSSTHSSLDSQSTDNLLFDMDDIHGTDELMLMPRTSNVPSMSSSMENLLSAQTSNSTMSIQLEEQHTTMVVSHL